MSEPTVRLSPPVLRSAVLVALAALLLVPSAAAARDHTIVATDKLQAAEARLLRHVNRIRKRNGRAPLRLDKRTTQAARARSADMAAKQYFAHVEPDGDDAGRILRRRDISAVEVSENIGQTFGLSLRRGSKRMATWWYRSPPHRAQMLARDINYIGLGIARRGSRFTYTAIFTRSRDKTRPRVIVDETSWLPSGDGSQLTVDWHGVDPKLATGHTGIERFEVEHLGPAGGWRPVDGERQRSKRSFKARGVGDQHVRIRAVDHAGNVGPWTYARIDVPDGLPRLV